LIVETLHEPTLKAVPPIELINALSFEVSESKRQQLLNTPTLSETKKLDDYYKSSNNSYYYNISTREDFILIEFQLRGKSVNKMNNKELQELSKKYTDIYFYLKGEIRCVDINKDGVILEIEFKAPTKKSN